MNQFLKDVIKGLSAKDKFLESKYFYDAKGDVLFQKIMDSEEYYPTRCEMEIFTKQTQQLVLALTNQNTEFDVVELGAGDATKSVHLLKGLLDAEVKFTYYPVDISKNVISLLSKTLPQQFPGLQMQGLNGEYLQMLEKSKQLSSKPKLVLFLGGNIGNVPYAKAGEFCRSIREHMSAQDLILIGFDLKKDPKTILAAYNDKAGHTREFNLNLLHRVNDELKGDFVIDQFYHYPTYDPQTGACKSFLVSKKQQQVNVADESFHFEEGEPIFMEIAQKYTVNQTDELARQNGFEPVTHFFDLQKRFVDAIWRAV